MYVSSLGFGMGVGICAFSLAFRCIYSPMILMSQVNALKMQMLQPEQNAYRQTMTKLYKSNNRVQLNQLNQDFNNLKRKHGIKTGISLMPLTQIPFLISFFWTLQDLSFSLESYPGMVNDGFLWFKNLSEPDPYYLLPLGLATSTFLSVMKSPNTSILTGPIAKYAKYIKYFIFLGLPITSTFPSGIVLNWFIMSFFQLMINSFVYTKTGRNILRIPDVLPGSLSEKMSQKVIVEVIKPVITSQKPIVKK